MIDESSTVPVFPDDVDVAVVSHNGRATLPRLLACLRAAAAPIDRITIYDIGSTDGTAEWLASAWPGVAVRRLDDNVGPNPARNRALRETTRPILLLLDADAYLRPSAAALLRAALDSPGRIGMVAPVVVQAERPEWIQYAGVDLHFICEAVNPWLNRPLAERGTDRRDLGSAPGVALLIDVATARTIGLWDERYFMGKDDGDFCYRLRLAGYRLIEEPRAIVAHGSRPRSAWMFPYQIRNRWYFMLKNYRAATLLVLLPALAIHEALQFLLLAAKGHLGAWWRAVRDIVKWIPTIGPARRAVQESRTIGDRQLLVSAPLLVREDLVGGRAGGFMKRSYDKWLKTYWAVVRQFIS
jgi:GT2 family glycosyltransferase